MKMHLRRTPYWTTIFVIFCMIFSSANSQADSANYPALLSSSGTPKHTRPGGTRPGGNRCPVTKLPVTPITRETQDFTLSEQPTLWIYMPYTRGEVATIEFSLHNFQQTKTLYRTTLQAPAVPGIIAVPIQPNISIKIGENYRWSLLIDCQAKKETDVSDLSLHGWIQRREMPANFVQQLQSTPTKERTQRYLEAGGWYDALTHLAKLRLQNPQDANLQQQWIQLLRSAGWDNLIEQPLVKP